MFLIKNGPADPVTILIQTLLLPGHSIFVIEKVVCVQGVVAESFPHTAVICDAAPPRCLFAFLGLSLGVRSTVTISAVAYIIYHTTLSPPFTHTTHSVS